MTLDPQAARRATDVAGTGEQRRQVRGCAVVTLVAVALMDDFSRGDIDDDAAYDRRTATIASLPSSARRNG
jgi:hypothetical protein